MEDGINLTTRWSTEGQFKPQSMTNGMQLFLFGIVESLPVSDFC